MESPTCPENSADGLSAALGLLAIDAVAQHDTETMAFIAAVLSEAATSVVGKVWTTVSRSWYGRAAGPFFIAQPFLIAAITVWGLKKAAEIIGQSLERGLEKAAEIRGQSLERGLEKAAEIRGRSLENAAGILVGDVRQVGAGGTTVVGLRAGAARAPHSSPFSATRH